MAVVDLRSQSCLPWLVILSLLGFLFFLSFPFFLLSFFPLFFLKIPNILLFRYKWRVRKVTAPWLPLFTNLTYLRVYFAMKFQCRNNTEWKQNKTKLLQNPACDSKKHYWHFHVKYFCANVRRKNATSIPPPS